MSGGGSVREIVRVECPFTPYTKLGYLTKRWVMPPLAAVPKFPWNHLPKTVAYKCMNTKRTVQGFVSQVRNRRQRDAHNFLVSDLRFSTRRPGYVLALVT